MHLVDNSNIKKAERALLAALISDGDDDSLAELGRLAESAGAEVVGEIVQKKEPNSATLFGKGKIDEIKAFIKDNDVSIFICDNDLSGVQMRNLSDEFDVKILDRSSLILDIFAQRAVSTEGKLQVELAQLKYNLPRLIGIQGRMAKYGGGIGMRGPGEKKLETDRRIIHRQITDLSQKLKAMEAQRELRRAKRNKSKIKTVALVGYTNAGKSTIMNLLSKSEVYVKDRLFATLDPVTRKVFVFEKTHYLLTDTVGFIDRLPHEFIEAFSSTLEEAKQADLLLHVMDSSDSMLVSRHETVLKVLDSMKIPTENVLTVYNKIDILAQNQAYPTSKDTVFVSALSGEGIENLKTTIIKRLFG